MALAQSPGIVTNGLVFAYDMNSKRSYKGPPLQNKLSGLSATAGSGTGYVLTASAEIANIPTVGELPVTICNLQNTGASWCCVNFMNFGNTGSNMSGSTLYTYMILYRVDSGYTNGNFMYRYEYNSSGTYLTEGGVHDTNKRTYLGNGWYYAWNTFTTQPTTTNMTCYGFSYNYSNFTDRYSYAKVAIVQGDYSGMHPSLWPDLGTTRSNTQALLDLTNNNTITAQSLTYASNGTFSFNGSQYLSIPDNALIRPSSGYITTEVWFKATATGSQNGSILINKENEYEISAGGGYITYAFRPNWAWVGATAFNTNQNYCVTITYDQINQKMYLNGVEVYSAALTGAIGNVYSDTLKIGARGGTGSTFDYFTGNIYNVKIYNRALSPSEVAQNFAAQRGLYGV
jgi:hypothetical protein